MNKSDISGEKLRKYGIFCSRQFTNEQQTYLSTSDSEKSTQVSVDNGDSQYENKYSLKLAQSILRFSPQVESHQEYTSQNQLEMIEIRQKALKQLQNWPMERQPTRPRYNTGSATVTSNCGGKRPGRKKRIKVEVDTSGIKKEPDDVDYQANSLTYPDGNLNGFPVDNFCHSSGMNGGSFSDHCQKTTHSASCETYLTSSTLQKVKNVKEEDSVSINSTNGSNGQVVTKPKSPVKSSVEQRLMDESATLLKKEYQRKQIMSLLEESLHVRRVSERYDDTVRLGKLRSMDADSLGRKIVDIKKKSSREAKTAAKEKTKSTNTGGKQKGTKCSSANQSKEEKTGRKKLDKGLIVKKQAIRPTMKSRYGFHSMQRKINKSNKLKNSLWKKKYSASRKSNNSLDEVINAVAKGIISSEKTKVGRPKKIKEEKAGDEVQIIKEPKTKAGTESNVSSMKLTKVHSIKLKKNVDDGEKKKALKRKPSEMKDNGVTFSISTESYEQSDDDDNEVAVQIRSGETVDKFLSAVPGPLSPSHSSYDNLLSDLEKESARRTKAEHLVMDVPRISVRQHYRDVTLIRHPDFTHLLLTPATTKVRNAIGLQTLRELTEVLSMMNRDDRVKVVLITSASVDSMFCAGVDLKQLLSHSIEERHQIARGMVDALRSFLKALVSFQKLIAIGVSGACIGLGVSLLPYCDLIYASDKATFQMPCAQLGHVPEGGATFTLPNLLGNPLANSLLLSGRRLTAAEGLQHGLVSQVLWPSAFREHLIPNVKHLASMPAQALAMSKALVRHQQRWRWEQAIDSECQMLVRQWASPECQLNIQAYLDSAHLPLQRPALT